jgi:hypothetical protein
MMTLMMGEGRTELLCIDGGKALLSVSSFFF